MHASPRWMSGWIRTRGTNVTVARHANKSSATNNWAIKTIFFLSVIVSLEDCSHLRLHWSVYNRDFILQNLFALAIALVCLQSRFHIAKSVHTCDCVCVYLHLRLRIATPVLNCDCLCMFTIAILPRWNAIECRLYSNCIVGKYSTHLVRISIIVLSN